MPRRAKRRVDRRQREIFEADDDRDRDFRSPGPDDGRALVERGPRVEVVVVAVAAARVVEVAWV